MIDTHGGTARLLDFVPEEALPLVSLCELTGDTAKARIGLSCSGLERRVANAWAVPANDLTCGQCRLLVGQRLGLKWLARPVATFAMRYPQAECDLYPGDLTVIALVALRDLAVHAPHEIRRLVAGDYGWLRREAREDQWSDSILKEAVSALDAATER